MCSQQAALKLLHKTLVQWARETKTEGIAYLHRLYSNCRTNIEICKGLQDGQNSVPWLFAYGVTYYDRHLRMAILLEDMIARHGRCESLIPTMEELANSLMHM